MKTILLPILIFITLLLGFLAFTAWYTPGENPEVKIGVSFSPQQAQKLGLDWQETYLSLLTNLKVRNIRLNSYWREIETTDNEYYFENLDFLVEKAAENGAQVMLVVGLKQPGWPECFTPDWAKLLKLKDRQKQALEFIEVVVERYKGKPTIEKWQVENEPLFNYGADCDPKDLEFLQAEVQLVRSLDPTREIVVTDSGELGFWKNAMSTSTIFGTTLYRKVHNPIFGIFIWPLPAGFYSLKSDLVREFFAPVNQKTIISELQAEPWFSKPLIDTKVAEQSQMFSLKDFQNNVNLAKNNHPEYLEYAKSLFK